MNFRNKVVKKRRETFSLADIKANKARYLVEKSAILADRDERGVGKIGTFECAFVWRVLISTLRRERGTVLFNPYFTRDEVLS